MKVSKKNQWRALGFVGILSMSASASAIADNTCANGSMSMSFDLSKTNNASIMNENTYIVVLGINPQTNQSAFIKFNKGKEVGKVVDVTDLSVNGKDFGIALSELTTNPGELAQVCIPKLNSGRIYLSFGNPLDMRTNLNDLGQIKVAEPNVNDPSTTSNGTLFDKIEFTYLQEGISYINPTGVDFLAIPYTIKQAGLEYGHAGSIESVVQNMKTIVCKAGGDASDSPGCSQRWARSEWSSLVVYNSKNQLLRVDAPGRSGDKFDNYFRNYLNELSHYYTAASERAIKVDLRELNQGTWSGRFDPNSQNLVFTKDGGDGSETVSYDMGITKASNSIFMGDQAPFGGSQIKRTIARDLTSAIVSGMLMRKEPAFIGKDFMDSEGNPVFKNKEQMEKLTAFYFNNGDNSVDYKANQCGVNQDAPCVNVYSEAVHALTTDKNVDQPQPSFLNSYAFAYDDFLGMDGTNVQSDKKPATIVIGDMKDRKIPHVE